MLRSPAVPPPLWDPPPQGANGKTPFWPSGEKGFALARFSLPQGLNVKYGIFCRKKGDCESGYRALQAFNQPGPRWAGVIISAPQTQQVGLLGTERLAPHSDQPTDGVLTCTTALVL